MIEGMKSGNFMKGKKRNPPYGALARDILRYVAIGAGLFIILSSPVGTRRLLKDIKKEWRKKNVLRTLDSLRSNRLISYQKKGNGTCLVTMTQSGKKKIKEWDVENMKIQKPALWDKRWRVVTFDIKEDRKKGRDALRFMLRRLGFYQLQKSVFVHSYPCRAEIEFIRDLYNVPEREVLYFSTDRIPHEIVLKKYFKLR